MKMFVVFVILLHVSQHALAAVVEVHEGQRSVLLPCQYSGVMPEDPAVMWTRSDLDPKSVHLQREGGDDLRGQNQRYRGRTSMRPDALDAADFSLTLRNPQLTDSSSYTCSISNRREERRLADVQLQVKDHQVEVNVEERSESAILPCKTNPGLPEGTAVEWTRSDTVAHVYPNTSDPRKKQDDRYCGRTKMNEDLLRTGDLSLTLKYPTERDTGGYICTIYRGKDILRQRVVLQVKEQFPSWAKVLLVLLGLLVVSGLLFYFRQHFTSDYKVEVDSGVEAVQLPCKAIVCLRKVEWKDSKDRMVHVYSRSSDQSGEQHRDYRDRTEMKRNLLRPGDLSLTLKHPTDSDTYTCNIYSKAGCTLKKHVVLKVKGYKVEVDSGEDSVELPFKIKAQVSDVDRVEWRNTYNVTVDVYQKGQDEEQHQIYKGRTRMDNNLLESIDFSLTLKYPTDGNTGTYTCTAYSKEGHILMRKQVELKVKVPQKEVDSGEDSVELPCKNNAQLSDVDRVEWRNTYNVTVDVYQKGQDEEQHQIYKGRTRMDNNLLESKDFSLTLKYPTDGNTGTYTCTAYSKEGHILMRKQVELKVKECLVEVEEGAESVELPFKTTGDLHKDATIEWEYCEPEVRKVHVYHNGSHQPGEQDQNYRDRTSMNEEPLRTTDLSLTLKHPTERDSGRYRCEVKKDFILLRRKTLFLKVGAQVQDQTGIIRNSAIDPTALMADQSV